MVVRVIAEEGLGLDVVSGGRCSPRRQRLSAGRTYFHGNNKGEDELAMARGRASHEVVVDNLEEIEALATSDPNGHDGRCCCQVAPGVVRTRLHHIKARVLDTSSG
jgi:diaminopimelate decarboxylase